MADPAKLPDNSFMTHVEGGELPDDLLAQAGQMARGFGYGVINPFHITSSLAKKYGGARGQEFNRRASTAMREAPKSAGAGQAVGTLLGAGLATGMLPEMLTGYGGGMALFGPVGASGATLGDIFDRRNDKGEQVDALHDRREADAKGIGAHTFGGVFRADQPYDDYIISHFAPKTPMTYPDTSQAQTPASGWARPDSVASRALDTSYRRQHERTRTPYDVRHDGVE